MKKVHHSEALEELIANCSDETLRNPDTRFRLDWVKYWESIHGACRLMLVLDVFKRKNYFAYCCASVFDVRDQDPGCH